MFKPIPVDVASVTFAGQGNAYLCVSDLSKTVGGDKANRPSCHNGFPPAQTVQEPFFKASLDVFYNGLTGALDRLTGSFNCFERTIKSNGFRSVFPF